MQNLIAALPLRRIPAALLRFQKGLIIMTRFEYTITTPVGIHTRHAGLLARTAKALDSTITIGRVGDKPTLATRLLAVMGLNIKKGDTVSVTVEGGNEETNAGTMEWLFRNNL